MKKKKTSEDNRIRNTALLTYIAVFCFIIFTLVQISFLKDDISAQRDILNRQYEELKLTNNLAVEVYRIQSLGGIYLNNTYKDYSSTLAESKKRITETGDSLVSMTHDDNLKNQIREIMRLINEKEKNRSSLERLLKMNPIEDLNKSILEIDKTARKNSASSDSVVVETVIRDTILRENIETNFWKRLQHVFAQNQYPDSTSYLSTVKLDTVHKKKVDSIDIVSHVLAKSNEVKIKYNNTIENIVSEINSLLDNDWAVTTNISKIIVSLHENRLQKIDSGLSNTEDKINGFFRFIFATAIVSFISILALLYLLLNSFVKLEKANKSLEMEKRHVVDMMESRHKLLLSVVHDIKTPLSAISGYLELEESEGLSKNNIETMKNSAGYINTLLENLLKYTALNKGRLTLEKECTDITGSIHNIVNMLGFIASSKGSSIIWKNSIPDSMRMNIDRLKTEQVITNILSNSIKYGNGKDIYLYTDIHEGCLQIKIKDNGIGIPKDKLEYIFELFSRMDEGKKVSSGDGIGLYVVKGLVDIMGGTIDVSSTVKEGTEFNVSIPAEVFEETAELHENEVRKDLRIAVIDDDRNLTEIFVKLMRKRGVENVRHFNRLEDLQVSVIEEGYDIVVTDFEMGDTNGYNVLEFIRNSDAIRHTSTYVALLTGRASTSLEQSGSLSFDGIFSKPLNTYVIDSILHSHSGKETHNENNCHVTFYEMFGDDPESLNEILETLSSTLDENVNRIRTCIASNDSNTACRTVHKMKPSIIQAGCSHELESLLEIMDSWNRNRIAETYWKDTAERICMLCMELKEKIDRDIKK